MEHMLNIDTQSEYFYCKIKDIDIEAEISTINGVYEVVRVFEGSTEISDDMIIKEYEIYQETRNTLFTNMDDL